MELTVGTIFIIAIVLAMGLLVIQALKSAFTPYEAFASHKKCNIDEKNKSLCVLGTTDASVLAEDTLKIDTILKHDFNTYYNFHKQTPLILSGNNKICPNNDLKMILDKCVDTFTGTGLTLNMEPNKMTSDGYLKLTGSGEDKCIVELLFICKPITI